RLRRARDLPDRRRGRHPLQADRPAHAGDRRGEAAAARKVTEKMRALVFTAFLFFFSVVKAENLQAENRIRNLEENLRCLVCQNQTLADSNAELAEDLRKQVREQVAAGKTDEQIVDYLVQRYGDFVLYDPPLKARTLLLWFGPFALLAGAGAGLVLVLR